jgi:hypothetical protein
MEKKEFAVPMELVMQSLNNYLEDTSDEEFLYFLLNIPKIININAERKGMGVLTKCDYNLDKLIERVEKNKKPSVKPKRKKMPLV